MTMMLGAEVGELASLAAALTTTGEEILHVNEQTSTVSERVTSESKAAFEAAFSAITESMATLESTVNRSQTQLEGTTWSGQNKANFDQAYMSFGGAMHGARETITSAYQQFNGQMNALASAIDEFQIEIRQAMLAAEHSTQQMSTAVTSQQANLEQAMNTGISFG